jgi:murein DD-endopeptidase MepM/ murein hydrolase activator NlpD
MTTNSHSTRGFRRIAVVLAIVFAACGALAVATPRSHASARRAADSSYGWPVKPFDQPHPVRGSFGDPRTIFVGPPSLRTLMSGAGSFQFHFGIDVSAPDGTPVYPVVSGHVLSENADRVFVDAGDGRTFEYWHSPPRSPSGQRCRRTRRCSAGS